MLFRSIHTGTAPFGAIIEGNTINTISATNAGAVAVTSLGIGYSNPTGGIIRKNRIYDIRNASTGVTATAPPNAVGIMVRAAPDFMEVSNNMISLGDGQTTNTEFIGLWNSFNTIAVWRVYYNSVHITGSAAAGALPSFALMRGLAFDLGPQNIRANYVIVGHYDTEIEGSGSAKSENVKDLSEADGVARHYLEGIDRIRDLRLPCEPSIKLTQLGLDIDRELAFGHLRSLAAAPRRSM